MYTYWSTVMYVPIAQVYHNSFYEYITVYNDVYQNFIFKGFTAGNIWIDLCQQIVMFSAVKTCILAITTTTS